MSRRRIRTDKHFIELSVVHTITKVSDGQEIPVKQIYARKWFSKDAITSVEEYVTNKNEIAKARSIVFDKYSSRFYATWHSPQEVIRNLCSGSSSDIGFNKKS